MLFPNYAKYIFLILTLSFVTFITSYIITLNNKNKVLEIKSKSDDITIQTYKSDLLEQKKIINIYSGTINKSQTIKKRSENSKLDMVEITKQSNLEYTQTFNRIIKCKIDSYNLNNNFFICS